MPGGTPSRPAAWSAREALQGLGLAILVAGLLGIASSPLSAAFDRDSAGELTVGAVATLAFELGLVLVVFRFTLARGASPAMLGWTFSGWKLSGSALALAACYAALYSYVAIINLIDQPGLLPAGQLSESLFDYPLVVGLTGLSVILVAPITEELFFRGFLFRGISNTFGVWPAAIATGFVFSLAHINLGAIIPFTLIGAIFAISYQRSGSLVTPIATHFAFNLISFSVLVLVPEARN